MKTCIKCGQCKPLTEYYQHIRTLDGYRSNCKACYNAGRVIGTGKPGWSDAEDAIIREFYPTGGVPACLERMTRRTYKAIKNRAGLLKVRTTAYIRRPEPEPKPVIEEAGWPVPADDRPSPERLLDAALTNFRACSPAANLAPSLGRWAA